MDLRFNISKSVEIIIEFVIYGRTQLSRTFCLLSHFN